MARVRVPAAVIVAAVAFTFVAHAHHRTSEIRPYDSVTKVDARLMNLPPKGVVEDFNLRLGMLGQWVQRLANGWSRHCRRG